jgi:hypothetical protein
MNRLHRRFVFLLSLLLFTFSSALLSADDQPSTRVVIGKVIAGSGTLFARTSDGEERRLERRSPIYEGDTVSVGENGFLQMRFIDSTLIALQPKSEFAVEEYVYHGKEDGSGKVVFNLLKGGLRTISGTIGKKDPENYQMKTEVATIGIRGTHYGLRYCQQSCDAGAVDGLYGGVLEGKIHVNAKAGGEGLFGKDGFFFVNPLGKELQRLDRAPGFVFVEKEIVRKDVKPREEGGKGGKGDDGKKEGAAVRVPTKPGASTKVVPGKVAGTITTKPTLTVLPKEGVTGTIRTDTLKPVNTLPVLSPTTSIKPTPVLQTSPILQKSPTIQLQTTPILVK